MNLFLREMKSNRKSLILWCIGILFMVAAGMGKYAGFSGSGQSVNEIISTIPGSLKAVLSFGSFDLTTAVGFYGMLFSYLAIMTAIHATIIGATIISKEERDKTSEFLMAKPVSRYSVVSAKLSAAFLNVLTVNLVTFAVSYLMVGYYSKNEAFAGDILNLMLVMMAVQLIFMLAGSTAAAAGKRPRIAASVASGIMLAAYVLDKVIDLNKDLDFLKYLTPFKYFNAAKLLGDTGFEPVFVILSVIIVLILLYITFVSYRKRDLSI
ncbi:MAG: ABC transporter [Ruminiclostridium sp.]|nr:ABC transporter [Ruminiclostridium sp.]